MKRNQIIRKEPVEKKAEELENANKRKLSVLKEAVSPVDDYGFNRQKIKNTFIFFKLFLGNITRSSPRTR